MTPTESDVYFPIDLQTLAEELPFGNGEKIISAVERLTYLIQKKSYRREHYVVELHNFLESVINRGPVDEEILPLFKLVKRDILTTLLSKDSPVDNLIDSVLDAAPDNQADSSNL